MQKNSDTNYENNDGDPNDRKWEDFNVDLRTCTLEPGNTTFFCLQNLSLPKSKISLPVNRIYYFLKLVKTSETD